tara:strand:+ start:145 stop:486 length:342 start_codon:yes stop_codon:yes gene_type:complete
MLHQTKAPVVAIAHHRLERDTLPVVGVSVGDESDRSTWHANLLDSTSEQDARARELLDTFDLEEERERYSETEIDALLLNDHRLQLIIHLVAFGSTTKTQEEVTAEARQFLLE